MLRKFKNILKMTEYRVLLKNFSALGLVQIANYLLPLLTMPYLVRVLGAERYGLLAFATSIILYFKVVTDYGFDLTATREISIHHKNRDKLSEIFSSVLMVKFLLLLFCFTILLLLQIFVSQMKEHAIIFYITFLMVVGHVLFPVWFFQGMERMGYISVANIGSKIVFTIGVFVLVKKPDDFWIVPLLTSLGYIFSGIFSIVVILKKFNVVFQFQSFTIVWGYVRKGWDIFLSNLMPNMYNNFSTFYLGLHAPMEQVGYFSVASRIVEACNGFVIVARNATFPFLVKNPHKIKKISIIMIAGAGLMTGMIFVGSYTIFPYLFGDSFSYSLSYLLILGLSPLMLSIAYSYGSNRLIVLGRDSVLRNVTILYSIIGFCIAIVTIPMIGAFGAAVTIILTRLFMASLLVFASVKNRVAYFNMERK